MQLAFEAVLPRLMASYERGHLVPFLGAGMSFDRCVLWPEFVSRLEARALGSDLPAPGGDLKLSAEALVRRANAAVFRLKLAGTTGFHEAIGKSLEGASKKIPAQTAALARLYWPLVLSTNYDGLFVEAWNKSGQKRESGPQVLGRSADDCRRVLASLHKSRAPVLWALQGHLSEAASRDPELAQDQLRALAAEGVAGTGSLIWRLVTDLGGIREAYQRANLRRNQRIEALRDQIVVGHAEYRRVAVTEPHFRRVFSEVFRTRSFLFLGSSLADPYLLDLFGEVLEVFGANPFPHYALVKSGEVDVDFLRQRLNTLAVEYEDHQKLPELLEQLHQTIERRSARTETWTFSVAQAVGTDSAATQPGRLLLVRGGMRREGEREAVAIPAEWDNDGLLMWTQDARKRLSAFDSNLLTERVKREPDRSVIQLSNRPVLLIDRTLIDPAVPPGGIHSAIAELMEAADKAGFSLVRIAAPVRAVSARFFVMAAIAGYGRWCRLRHGAAPVQFAIHLTDPGVLFDLSTGRIDPGELLLADDLRLMVEVLGEQGATLAEVAQYPADARVAAIAQSFGIPSANWFVEIDPSPVRPSLPLPLAAIKERTLADLGAVTDATLRFVQMNPIKRAEPKPAEPAKSGAPPTSPPQAKPDAVTSAPAAAAPAAPAPARRRARTRKPRSRKSL